MCLCVFSASSFDSYFSILEIVAVTLLLEISWTSIPPNARQSHNCSASPRPPSDPSPATPSPRSATRGADSNTPDSHVRNRDGQKDNGFAGKQLVKGTRGGEKREQSEEMGRCFNGILLTGWVGM